MARIKEIICPDCNVLYLRTVKQINVVIKNSGKWTCRSCVVTSRNKLLAKDLGSTRIHKQSGYVLEKTNDGWIRQHRLVMENHLNRKLLKDEVVHHIDHDIKNNRLSNLVLMKFGDHSAMHNKETKFTEERKQNISKANTKFSEDVSNLIKKLILDGSKRSEVANMFMTSTSTVARILRNNNIKGI